MRKSFRGAKSGPPDQIFQDMGSPRFAGSVRGVLQTGFALNTLLWETLEGRGGPIGPMAVSGDGERICEEFRA